MRVAIVERDEKVLKSIRRTEKRFKTRRSELRVGGDCREWTVCI